MDGWQLLDQNQFINPLSGQGFITDINNVWVEPALTVGSARLHEKRELLPRPYQNFEQRNHNPFSAYGTSTGLYRGCGHFHCFGYRGLWLTNFS